MSDNKHGIKKLNDFQHARKRINMYLGPNTPHTQSIALFDTNGYSIVEQTWIPAAFTSLREIVDNSLDEFVKANIHGTLKVQYDEDTLTFEISDNGRGIPIDWDPIHNCNLATMVLSELKAGRNFDDSERVGVGGMNGIGASAVCQVSEYMDLEIIREGTPLPTNKKAGRYKFTQRFEEGKRYLTDDLVKLDPNITSTRSDKTGTTIKFKLSPDVFTHVNDPEYKGKILPINMVRSLLMEIAVNQPLHKIFLNGEKLSPKSPPDKAWFSDYKPMILPINTPGFVSTFYIVPDGAPDWFMHSTVNNIPVFDGGPHVSAFKTAFALGVIKALEKESKRKKLKPNRLDVEQSLFVYNITVMDAPFFTSQAKTKLSNDEVERTVAKAMTDEYFDELVKKNKAWVNSIFERCADRTNKKDADEVAKQAKKMLKQKIAKLSDATGKRGNVQVPIAEKILFLTEGDSAAAGLNAVRDPAIHGILPLRGKIMNISDDGIKLSSVMNSQALADIMNAVGLVPGIKAVRSELRYGNILIATDSDHDGANIAALIINFLYTYWPELFNPADEPFVWIFLTPFIILEKGKQRKYFYGHEYANYDQTKWVGWNTRRAKGLGTLERVDWQHAVNNINAIPMQDDGELKQTLDLIFNKTRADDRKIWVTGGMNEKDIAANGNN